MKSAYGRGLDWPFSYNDLAPYYDRVAQDIGVSGDAKAEERWRPPGHPYPMPPIRSFRHGDVWLKGFEALGIKTARATVAINSQDYKGRPACVYDGWCNAGCPIGALANPSFTYLDEARKLGAEVRPFSTVTRVLTNNKGDRVTGIEYYDRAKQRQVQEASIVILAAFVSQNPRILLNSATDKHPDGLANANGLVGRYVMAHTGATIWGMFDEPDMQNYMGVLAAMHWSYDRYDKTARPGAFGSILWHCSPAIKPNDIGGIANSRNDLFGQPLVDFIKRGSRQLSRLQAFGEELPNPDNRVVLASEKDEFGFPLARINHAYDQDAVGVWQQACDEGLLIAKAAGAKESWALRAAPPTIHMVGGTAMGRSAADSVTNGYGQTHEIPNLWIAGVTLFPTEGAVNPTYTMYAASLRAAEHLAENWNAIAG
jgi:choline dehydrogenase-like flavoprotein